MAETAHDKALAGIAAMFDPKDSTEPPPEEVTEETAPAEEQATEATEQAPPEQSEEETAEVEIDGETYLVPKKISERFIQHADYTRKTQDIAEMRRALSAEREATALERAFEQSTREEQKQLSVIEASLDQFKKLDWSKIEDTTQLIHLRTQYDQLKDTRAELQGQLQAKREEFQQKIKDKASEAQVAGQKYIESHVKGFDEEAKADLFAYGLQEGYTRDELDRIVDPRIVVTLWKSRQWDALQAQKPAVTKRAAQAAPMMKPGNTQPQPSKAAQLNQAYKTARSDTDKRKALEGYFANLFQGGR